VILLIELIGALVLIGVCAYGASKLIESFYDRNRTPPDRKDPN
jgi:flagellar biogenesis protein FliO